LLVIFISDRFDDAVADVMQILIVAKNGLKKFIQLECTAIRKDLKKDELSQFILFYKAASVKNIFRFLLRGLPAAWRLQDRDNSVAMPCNQTTLPIYFL
jgi:hypothetical protein